ncbi:hypothetical protein C8Q78DRAFT_401707 [Trametes maxima]|nr:hypothetical protein C8Q78DRAFT_401707 [Trametes maxima]
MSDPAMLQPILTQDALRWFTLPPGTLCFPVLRAQFLWLKRVPWGSRKRPPIAFRRVPEVKMTVQPLVSERRLNSTYANQQPSRCRPQPNSCYRLSLSPAMSSMFVPRQVIVSDSHFRVCTHSTVHGHVPRRFMYVFSIASRYTDLGKAITIWTSTMSGHDPTTRTCMTSRLLCLASHDAYLHAPTRLRRLLLLLRAERYTFFPVLSTFTACPNVAHFLLFVRSTRSDESSHLIPLSSFLQIR